MKSVLAIGLLIAGQAALAQTQQTQATKTMIFVPPAQEQRYREAYTWKEFKSDGEGYKCDASTYISKQQSDMTHIKTLDMRKNAYALRTVAMGEGTQSTWKMQRVGNKTYTTITSPVDTTVIMSVEHSKATEDLKQKPQLKMAKLTVEGGMDKYEFSIKAGVPFKISTSNESTLNFEIPAEKVLMTCNTNRQELLGYASKPNPMVYGESIRLERAPTRPFLFRTDK